MKPSATSKPTVRELAPTGRGAMVHAMAALVWLPQAALLAWAVQRLADGQGVEAMWKPALGILLLGLVRSTAETWGARRVFANARAQLAALREQVVTALCASSPLERSRPASGLAASVIAEQAEAVVPYLVKYQPARLRLMIVPPAILLVVASLSWVAALVLLLAAPLIPFFMAIIGWRAQAASEAQMVQMGGMNAFLLDRLRGLATLRALGAVDATARRLDASAQSLRVRTMAVLRIAFLSSAVLELFSALGVAMVAVYIGFHLLGTLGFGAWGHTLSLGQGLFILLLAPAFFEPLRELSAVWHDRAAGEAAVGALHQLQHHELLLPGAAATLASVEGGASANHSAPMVHVSALDFSHPHEAPIFSGFDLRIASGEHVALTGASGSGKTVLLSLLAGLLPAARGEITIGGVPLTDRTIAALRGRIGWMGQNPHVFGASIQRNVTLGRSEASTLEVQTAMRFVGLGAVAQAHPGTSLGEGGGGLSGGEAVRLALARLVVAVHGGANLLLVDEPTAHLDSETAARVADALIALARGKTLLVATHDPVLIARMDRVLLLDPAAEREAA